MFFMFFNKDIERNVDRRLRKKQIITGESSYEEVLKKVLIMIMIATNILCSAHIQSFTVISIFNPIALGN